jgi:thymidylate synthase (FAD)
MRRFRGRIGYAKAIARSDLPQRRGCLLTAHPVRVVEIEFIGTKQTYDLCVEGPWHNFLANGIVVHNSFNEESARYHKLADDFYVPAPEAVRGQVGKPGSYTFEPVEENLAHETIDTLRRVYKELYAEYQNLIERGVAKELARTVLPFGIFTQFYWTINARALMNFISLRNSEFAQYEIRVYAEAVEQLFARQMPITHECFVEFGRKGP